MRSIQRYGVRSMDNFFGRKRHSYAFASGGFPCPLIKLGESIGRISRKGKSQGKEKKK